MISDPGGDAVAAAAEQFFPGSSAEMVEGRPWLRAVTTGEGRFSVRQLDPGLPAARVELVHELLGQPGNSQVTPLLAASGSPTANFDARRWIDGKAQGAAVVQKPWRTLHLPTDLTPAMLAGVAAALAEFHRSGSNPSLIARAPKFNAKNWLAATRRSLELDERALAGEIRKESRARNWLTAARPLLSIAETTLEKAGFLRDEPLVIAHLDLWGSHIVDSGSEEMTFLDCSSIAAAPQIIDLAQLLARNGAWSADRVELALTGYAAGFPIEPLQRRVLPWLTAASAISSAGHLLARAANERDPLAEAHRRAVLAAVDHQLDLLQTLAAEFVPLPPRPHRRPNRRQSRSGA